jgi:carbonic anhydrase/acetyltransferase-like protein (isoleucine patch superfamily)
MIAQYSPKSPLRSALIVGKLLLFVAGVAMGQQNVTVVAVDPADRLSGSTILGDWAAGGNLESWTGTNVTGLAAQGGSLTGSDSSPGSDGKVSLGSISGGPDLDLGYNDFLQVRLQLPVDYTGDVRIEFGTTVKSGFAADRLFVIPSASIPKDGAFHTYRLAMGLEVWWRDLLRDLRMTPLLSATGSFAIDYIEVGDVAGTEPALNLITNFLAPLNASNTSRMIGKHVCVWWDPTDTSFTTTHARRAIRMCEESYQVFCVKLGYNEPFRTFGSTTTTPYKINFLTWYNGYWAGGWDSRGHMNVGRGGLADEGWGNPVPHEFGHVVQMAQPGSLAGGHWESHANYLRAGRNLHFYDTIPGAIPAIDNLTGNSNYRPDHNRHIYADQRYYLGLDDFGTQFGLPTNFAAAAWLTPPTGSTLVEKLASALPSGVSVKDVACETLKHWPMLDFAEKTKLRAQHWNTTSKRNLHFWLQGAQLIPLQDKPGWWRAPLERAPDRWAYQMHDLTASAGATVTAELRGLDLPGNDEDWRWCFAAISSGDNVRYSPVWAPGTQSFELAANESQVFLIVTGTPGDTALDLNSFSNTKPVDKNADRLRYGYEVRLVNATPASHQFAIANPSGYSTHANGGGVVAPGASVSASAYVGPNAKVLENARVRDDARVEAYAIVKGSATVENNAVVSGFTVISGNAVVQDEARVRDRAYVTQGARVRGRALVEDYTKIENTTVEDDAIVRGCAYPWGGTIGGTAILDHDYSMGSSVTSGVHFSHVPWGGWWDVYYPQTLFKPRGLVASYRTEESDGEEWWDEFGAQHAFLRGAPSRLTDSTLGSTVVNFDGIDDYAAFDRSVADAPTFSFACWVRPGDTAGSSEPLLFLGSSATRALQLRRDINGRPVFTISNGTTNQSLTGSSVLTQNEWNHIALTLDGTSGKLFINGVPEASGSVTLRPLDILAANDHLGLQANYLARDWNGTLFKGGFEDARFYNVAMTEAEVRWEYFRRGAVLGQFSPDTPTDFDGTTTIAQSGVRNGRVRTLSAWVKPRSAANTANYQAIFDSDDDRRGRQGGGIGIDNGKWVARLDGLGDWTPSTSANTVDLNQWQHVALAFDGTSARLLLNGTEIASRSYNGPSGDSAAAGKCYRIGFSQFSEDTSSRVYFDGLILNARVYDRALTEAQIVLDADGDGYNDAAEVDAGTNPLDKLSSPLSSTVPTISAIADQSIEVNTATVELGFTVGDSQTSAGELTLSATSSNTTLVPVSNIAFGGSGVERTVTVTPTVGGTGSATITLTVTDADFETAETRFLLSAWNSATITLSDLIQDFDGSPKAAGYITDPPGLSVTVTYDGLETPPTSPGSYAVVATVVAPYYQGSASGTLEISPTGAPGNVISVTFNAKRTLGPADETGAVVTAGHWNNISVIDGAHNGTWSSLNDSEGIPTPASITTAGWSGILSMSTDGSAFTKLYEGGLMIQGDAPAADATVTLSGIPYALYDVYLYYTHYPIGSDTLQAWTESGAGVTLFGVNNKSHGHDWGDFTPYQSADRSTAVAQALTAGADGGGNWLRFEGLSAANLTLTSSDENLPEVSINGPGNSTLQRGIAGMQIVERVVSGDAYSEWIGGYPSVGGMTGFDEDPDGDGIGNGMESYLGTDPGAFSRGLTATSSDGSELTFTHSESNTIPSDVSADYEWSLDLLDWFDNGVGNGEGVSASISEVSRIDHSAPDNDVVTATATVSGPVVSIFVRLRATQSSP